MSAASQTSAPPAAAPMDKAGDAPVPAPRRLLGFRRVALIELILFFAVALSLDWAMGTGLRFEGVQPHPFWIPVLLLAVQYGTNEGVLAALVATLALRLGNLPEQTIAQDFYQYLFVLTREPILWLVSGVLIGELRMRQIREREELRASLDLARKEAEAITRSYRALKSVKETLETRVAGQLRTVFTLYQAAKSIDRLDEGEVMLGVADLVRSVMKPEKFSLFLLNGDVLESVTNEGWDDEHDSYARWFDHSSLLFETVVGRQRQLCVTRVEDERILAGEGVLAGPLISSDTGEVVGMVKIESLGFADFSVNTVDNFRILCEWIGTALAKARRYREANEQRVFTDDALYSSSFIGRQAEFLAHLGRRMGFETTSIAIRPSGLSRLSAAQRAELAAAIGRAVRSSLRDTDLACDFGQQGASFGVVLTGTGLDGAKLVEAKLEKAVRQSLPAELADIPIVFTTKKVEVSA
ncbi:GAF domain-containing protein [Azospirillum doebereinerae]|uniref:GAF domain-containing protein n=1 Tax=Azospirillum doebereinerae TaxID=92933 RepID=UPI001EE5315C|nr:GAF domain-containing protein [Azospirillum doebereinerae]MCG5242530.1 GAF domain-containing protein [Azospirillum doebereinerae]